jgi:5-(carboxyamino)imidazole ribonucleotide synthase
MRIAIAGCGQLARMLALAGWEMGHHFSFIADPGEGTDCVDGLGPSRSPR